uniref:MAM and LDL-receptor class A domain-containing protein 1 n=1 Tax=Magallana gigas TaxID=29159 RepID=K1QQ99_MAGGI
MSENSKSNRGRKRCLTDSARKRNRATVASKWNKSRVYIGNQFERWNELKAILNVDTHAEVANVLLNNLTIDEDEMCLLDDDSSDSDEEFQPNFNLTLRPSNADQLPIEYSDDESDTCDDDPADAAETDYKRVNSIEDVETLITDRPLLVYQQPLLDLANTQISTICKICNEAVSICVDNIGSATYLKWGRTPLYGTGPSNAAEGSRYAYIESTGNDPHSKASLERIVQIPKDGNMCLSFNYHMYGRTVGTLKVLFQDLIFFHEVGNKGDQWNKAEFTLFNVSSTVVSKIQFTATQGTGYEGDIAIDNIQLTEGKCARCTFEVGTECFLKDVEVTDDFDWTILSGETPSLETGPAKAFEGSRYAYIESSGIDPYSRASLEGIVQLPKDGDMCLSFNYHMYGETNDSLEVLFQNITYFNESGNKGNQWNKAKFSLFDQNSTVVSKIQFTATRGSSNKSDIAIDNIQLTEGGCVKDCRINPCRTNEICIQETSTTYRCDCRPGFIGHFCDVVPGQANCTFEKGEDCFLKNSTRNDFDWSLNSGRTPSSKTGPGSAKQGSWYAYIETTNRLLGQKAMLIPKYRFKTCDHITCKNGGTCLSKQNGGFCQCPPEFTGNRCEKKIGVLASCTFDDGSCFLTNINGQDTMDWLITKKRTPSLNTGPNKPLDGNYTFIEASGRTAGDNAILSSAATSQFFLRGPACLRFFYNMNGRGIGTLNVFAGESNSEQNVWNISGNQNDIWTPVAVDIPPVNDLVIWIEAIRGKSYLSDIAIDTIELFDSPCIASLSSLPQRCTFEDGADCFLKDDKKFDDFDWIVKYVRA